MKLRSFVPMILGVIAMGLAGTAQAADPQNVLYLDLKYGRVVSEIRPDLAANHVARIKELGRTGFYDGVTYHRVIADFMAQTGDPRGNGTGGSGKTLKAEFSKEPFVRGAVGMARAQDPDSADSQFFICLADSPWLDGQYTYWGKVIAGMEFVDQIKKGSGPNGMVVNPDRIVRMRVAADVKGEKPAPAK